MGQRLAGLSECAADQLQFVLSLACLICLKHNFVGGVGGYHRASGRKNGNTVDNGSACGTAFSQCVSEVSA